MIDTERLAWLLAIIAFLLVVLAIADPWEEDR